MPRNKAVVVGLDGVPASFLRARIDAGTMPAAKALLDDGGLVTMDSSVPAVSSVAWASLTTGMNPGRHGIFGFMELRPGTYDFRFPNAVDLHEPTAWDLLADDGGTAVVLNVPGTYPASAPKGSLVVSGFVAPRLDRSVRPRTWLPWLEEIGYVTDVDVAQAGGDATRLADDLVAALDRRTELWWRAWDEIPWDLFWGVITETDRLHHLHFGQLDDPAVIDAFDRVYAAVDAHLARVVERLPDDAALCIVSDHGFAPIRTEVFINEWLADAGFLEWDHKPARSLADLGAGTRLLSLDPGRLYPHLKNRYPLGTLSAADGGAVLRDVAAALAELRDPETGEPVAGEIRWAEDVYTGPLLADAPPLVVLPRAGWDPKGAVGRGVFARSNLTGMHSFDDALLYWRGPARPERARLEDVSASVLAHLGVAVDGLDGRPVLS